jgi:hypothetical protein
VGDGVELIVRPVDGPDPIHALYGFEAPAEWHAFGVVADGRGVGTAPTGVRQAVRLGVLVTRDGDELSLLRRADGSDLCLGRGDDRDLPLEGRVPDTCRRVLGLPTPPPDADPAELWATLWLDALLGAAAADPGAVDWSAAARAHPCFDAVTGGHPELADLCRDHLVELGRAARQAWPWAALLEAGRTGQLPSLGIPPDLATWMDEGMFSRELLGQLVPLPDLLAALGGVLGPDVLAQVRATLTAWEVV